MKGEESSKVSNVSFRAEPFAQLQLVSAGVAETGSGNRLFDGLVGSWQTLALVVLAAVALVMIKSVARQPAEERAFESFEQADDQEEVLLPQIEVDLDERRARKMRQTIEELVERDPQSALGLIRRWITKES